MKANLSTLEELTGKPYRTLKRLLTEANVSPVEGKGKQIVYDSRQALEGIYQGGSNQRALKDQLTAEMIREKKRQNDEAEGLLLPASKITEVLSKVSAIIRAGMDALPLEMKRANPRLTGHDIQIVKKSIAKCLNALAKTQLDEDE